MITLLNGETFEEENLLDLMQDDEFYYGYMAKAALSSSSIKTLLSSPKTYKYVLDYGSGSSQALRDGWLFHTCILEPHVFEEQIFVDVQSKNTKAYKEALAEHGKVFTAKEKRDAERVADAFLRNEHALKLLKNSEFEVPAVGMIDGYPFRGKADVFGNGKIVDLKTTTDIKAFPYSARKYGYDVQVYVYCSLFNVSYKDFTFAVVDKGSLDIAIYDVSEEFYNEGKRKTQQAIETFETFFINGADLDTYCLTGTL
jgi:hypothetical protein